MRHPLFQPDLKIVSDDPPLRKPNPTRGRGGGSDSTTVVKVLNQALRIAELTVLSSKRQYHIALRHHSPPLAAAALEHANDARLHADRIRQRIMQLGGTPEAPPDASQRTRTRSASDDPIATTITEHLIASRVAVESYSEIASFFAAFDDDTRKLMDEIATGEQERGDDLARLQRENARKLGAHRSTEDAAH